MLTKTEIIENAILSEIRANPHAAGRKIPSRSQLMRRFQCSRTVVERAVSHLTEQGYLAGTQGSGTFVRSAHPVRAIRRISFVTRFSMRDGQQASALFPDEFSSLPVHILRPEYAAAHPGKLMSPDSAVIWDMPSYDMIFLMKELRLRRIPQLLLNRDYLDFDFIQTDPESSIREGLSWLLNECGREIAFIGKTADETRPYQSARLIAFFQQSVDLGALLTSAYTCLEPFEHIREDISRTVMRLFGGLRPPKGVFILNRELVLPFIMRTQEYGARPGTDYKLLTFDEEPGLQGIRGCAMMRQPTAQFSSEEVRWLKHVSEFREERFQARLKTELLIQ